MNAARTFTAHLPDGTTKTRKSETMNYTHAVVLLERAHGFRPHDVEGAGTWGPLPGEPETWKVYHWCGRLDLAQKQASRYKGHKVEIVVVT